MANMMKLIRELRRRHVFRAAGLYIGGVWIVLQVADIVLPAYDAPNWVFRALISVALAGLPIAIWLAWVFDITATGIRHTPDVGPGTADLEAISGARKADFTVIAVLLIALGGSLFVNFAPRDPVVATEVAPVSVLIADFDNQTGDKVFDGAVEQVLTIGMEESSFVTAFDRTVAARELAELDEQSSLDAAGARLMAVREGVGIVVSGKLTSGDGKYEVSIDAVDPDSGQVLASFSERADDKTAVLAAVGELARSLREELGDVTIDSSTEGEETFTTVAIEAMHDYVLAQRLARNGKDEEALGLYQSAVAIDPEFGRAYSGLAVSAHKLGRIDIAEEAWPKALALMEGMTERERYRTAGVYYGLVARNSQKAIENYATLVEKFPADDAGHNNLAFAYFMNLKFDKALDAGRKVVDIYPKKPMYRANYALYAMYANDFETATAQAAKTLEFDPGYYKAYLPYAVAALIKGDLDAARSAYDKMAATGVRGASLASTGLADMMIWAGDPGGAEKVLLEGIKIDEANGNKRALATKKMIRAYVQRLQERDADEIVLLIEESLASSRSMSQLVQAALLYLEIGMEAEARAIAVELGGQLEAQQRAYSKMITALILRQDGEPLAAIDGLQVALAMADVWLLRYFLGMAYVDAEHFAEAVSEFQICHQRLGEAYSLFMDDTPTFRYTAELDSWMLRAMESMTAQHKDGAVPR